MPKFPLYFENVDLISDALLFLLSVIDSTITATPKVQILRRLFPQLSFYRPEKSFFIALSIVSLVIFEDKALLIAALNLGFDDGSGEPS